MPPLLPMFPPTRGRTATTTDTYTSPTKIQAGFGTLIQAGIVSFVSVFTPSKMECCAKRFDIRIEPTLAGRDEVPSVGAVYLPPLVVAKNDIISSNLQQQLEKNRATQVMRRWDDDPSQPLSTNQEDDSEAVQKRRYWNGTTTLKKFQGGGSRGRLGNCWCRHPRRNYCRRRSRASFGTITATT